MKTKITFLSCVIVLFLIISWLVLYFSPMSLFRYLPINDACLVYKYYSLDESGKIQAALSRSVALSPSDTETLFEELLRLDWRTNALNDWNNHKIIFTTALGIQFTVNLQTMHPDRVQINGSGAWLNSESSAQFASILNAYILDDYVAVGP